MRSPSSQISKCKHCSPSELVKVIQKHEETMCDILRHQGQAICLRLGEQVPCLKAIQKGSFTQNSIVITLWS